jgi:hypothetical protein
MAKILLVEKRYDGFEEKPSVTAQWIEIPDGKEESFLVEQLANTNEKFLPDKQNIKPSEIENELLTQQEVLAQRRLILILNLLPVGIVVIAAILVFVGLSYYGIWK